MAIKIFCNCLAQSRYIEIFRSTTAELRRSMFQNSAGNDRPSPYDRNNRGDRGSRMNNFGGNDFGGNNGRNNMRMGGDRRGGGGGGGGSGGGRFGGKNYCLNEC